MEAYKATGRTNKLLTYQSKSLILKQRNNLKTSGQSSGKPEKKRRVPKSKKSADTLSRDVTAPSL